MTNVSLGESGHDLTGLEAPPEPPAPLVVVPVARERSAAEHARLIVAGAEVATLASLSDDGTPWASLVAFETLDDGAPVVMVSTLAEHGRNLERDPRASMCFALPTTGGDHLARGRVTLAGRFVVPEGDVAEAAHAAYLAKMPAARSYSQYGDFSTYVLDVARVRWVGGYGTMASADADAYAAAEIDPVGDASGAVKHLNEDHADALLAMARALGGYPDALAARCTTVDRYGLNLAIETPRGHAPSRVGFAETVNDPAGLRAATVELTRLARS